MKLLKNKILSFVYKIIRPLFVKDIDLNEDFICENCCKPVLRRYLFCSVKCSDEANLTKIKNKPDEIIILECTFCLKNFDWNRTQQPDGFGYCNCKTAKFLQDIKQNQQFRVLKEHRNNNSSGVIVMSDKGWQKLNGPSWQENPTKWKQGPIKK